MNFEKLTIPGLTDDEDRTLNRLLEQLEAKAERNRLRSAYYDGRRAVRAVGTIIPPQYNRLALVLGWPAKAVDILARRCRFESFTWADGDLSSLGIEELMDSNFLASEIAQARTDSLIHGVSYLVTTRGGEGEPRALVHAKDALSATGTWNNRTRRLDDLLSITSRDDQSVTGLVLYLDGLTITADKDSSGWTVDRQEHPWGVPAEPLVYRPRSSRRMGSSRITRPVMSITDQAMRAVVRLEAHMDIYAIPKMIMLGADESIFKNPDGSQKASWQIALGRAFGIPDDDEAENPRADVKQFDASSPQPHLAHLNALSKLLAREASLPDSAVAITDFANPTSAEAYDAAQYELIAEGEGAIDDWSMPLRRTAMRALAIQNGLDEVPAEWASIRDKWGNPRFISRAAEADAGGKQLAAVPWLADTEVGLELLGLSDAQIERALADQRRQAGRDVLAGLREAVRSAPEPSSEDPTQEAARMKALFDALGAAIRAGVDPEDAARRLGLEGIKFTGATPVSLRLPEDDAARLEAK